MLCAAIPLRNPTGKELHATRVPPLGVRCSESEPLTAASDSKSFRERAANARVPAMKRLLLVILLGAIAALTAYYIVRQHPAAVPSTIANLLPADTALFIHMPDAEKNRDAWHRTDLYQLYREPA